MGSGQAEQSIRHGGGKRAASGSLTGVWIMKSGRSLTELATELERQANSKKDFIAPNGKLHMQVVDGQAPVEHVVITGVNGGMQLTPIAHGQLANVLGIPKAYYDKMLSDKPDLLATNVNRWL